MKDADGDMEGLFSDAWMKAGDIEENALYK